MPNAYIENAEKWRALADIDYFTQFVKAWISFNAWYKNAFDHAKDSQAINYIKTNSNPFRDRMHALLNSDSTEGKLFQSWTANLSQQLEKYYIYADKNRTQRVTFYQIVVERNLQKRVSYNHYTFVYTVERGPGGITEQTINITIAKYGGGPTIFSYTQVDGYDLDDLLAQTDFCQLTEPQANTLKACYEDANPQKPVCLIAKDVVQDMDASGYQDIGGIWFVDDTDLLCKGLIVILYNLRNSLFHGTLVPDSQTRQVYEPAYHILHALIQKLD